MKRREIDIDLPEEYFRGEVLEKGFNLFRQNFVEFQGKERSLYHFLVGKRRREEVTVSLSKNRIKSYTCTCGKSFCMHLCASVFYLKRENYSSENSTGISGGFEKIFKSYVRNLNELQKSSVLNLLEAAKKFGPEDERVFFLLSGLIYFLRRKDFRFSEDELGLVFSELTGIKLSEKHSGFLFFTIKESLKSERKFSSALWFYLIPFLETFRNHLITEELKELFGQRKVRQLFPGNIDLKEAAISVLNSPGKICRAEDFIAKAMIEFSRKRISEAFKVLDRGIHALKKSKAVSLGEYIRFVMQKAQQFRKSELFLNYARELLLAEPFIDPLLYKEITEILPEQEKQKFYDEIIMELRNKPNRQELIFEIQFQNKMWSELVREIKIRNGKFYLLNKAALAMLPQLNPDLLKYYPVSLVNAINSAPDSNYRNFLFEQAGIFLKQIPPKEREIIIEKILEKLGGKDHLAGRFLKLP